MEEPVARQILDVMSTLQHNFFELQNNVMAMHASFEDFKIEVRHDIRELKSEVSGLKGEISELKRDVSELKHEVTELKQNVERLDEKVTQIDIRTERLERRMDMTFDAVGDVKETVSELNDKHERHEMLLGEIAKSLLEQAARSRRAINPI
ncbi:hypothetical protein [Cohnella soli]|uniref:Uncharacterized protein n=1 Tax=Cohnella soli TaxID=425005 RepID=A0ABW0HT36_9BACL